MKIKDLKEEHPAIYELAMKRRDKGADENNAISNAFEWSATPEGDSFWLEISRRNYQVFYDRYPEHAKDPVKFSIEEKDWSKATDEELIAEAKRRYPKGTTIESTYGTIGTVTDGFFMFKGSLCLKTTGPSCIVYSCMMNRWAEIVSQPKTELHEASPEAQQQFVDNNPGMRFGVEPKAGDMVEVSCNGWLSGWTYLGIKTSYGAFVCEQEDGAVDRFLKIRLPQKSEVESKIEELCKVSENTVAPLKVLFKEAIKWGQQNKDAK